MTLPASVDTPATVDRAEATTDSPAEATPMPEADPAAAAQVPSDEPASLASEIARRRLGERLRRIAPFFAGTRRGFVLAFVGAVVAAATEPAIPALLKVLLDDGMKQSGFPLWLVPIAIIGLTVIRGLAGFISQYGLAWAANRGTQAMRTGDVPARPRRRARCSSRATRRATSSTPSPSRSRTARPSSSTRCRAWSATRSASSRCSATWSGSTGS